MGYLIGLVVVAVGAMLLRKYLYSRPITFDCEGGSYVRLPDGRFFTREGLPVHGPQLEAVKAHWDRMEGYQPTRMSWAEARD
ncbi:MAG TPA: hypothetical protein VGE84_04235 [Allosphingosinicella sp.]